MTTVTGVYTSGNDKEITADACYALHANQRFLNSTSSLLNKVLDPNISDAADKTKCIGASGKLTGPNAFPYSCMNIAMQHCDSWSSDNDRAKACGRELLRNNCVNQATIDVYKASGMTIQPVTLTAVNEGNRYVLKADGIEIAGGTHGIVCKKDASSMYTCIAVNDNDCWVSPIDVNKFKNSAWSLSSVCSGYYGDITAIQNIVSDQSSDIKAFAPLYTEKLTKYNYCTNACVSTIVPSPNNDVMPLDMAIAQGRIKSPLTFKQAVEQALIEKHGFICYDQKRCYMWRPGEYEGMVGSGCQSSARPGGGSEDQYQCFGSVDTYSYH